MGGGQDLFKKENADEVLKKGVLQLKIKEILCEKLGVNDIAWSITEEVLDNINC